MTCAPSTDFSKSGSTPTSSSSISRVSLLPRRLSLSENDSIDRLSSLSRVSRSTASSRARVRRDRSFDARARAGGAQKHTKPAKRQCPPRARPRPRARRTRARERTRPREGRACASSRRRRRRRRRWWRRGRGTDARARGGAPPARGVDARFARVTAGERDGGIRRRRGVGGSVFRRRDAGRGDRARAGGGDGGGGRRARAGGRRDAGQRAGTCSWCRTTTRVAPEVEREVLGARAGFGGGAWCASEVRRMTNWFGEERNANSLDVFIINRCKSDVEARN